MRRSTSDSRARAEIAKTLETYVAVLSKVYEASTTAGGMSASSEEQHVHQALKTYSQMELSGVVIIDHWLDNDGTEYALAQLEMASFKDNLDKIIWAAILIPGCMVLIGAWRARRKQAAKPA